MRSLVVEVGFTVVFFLVALLLLLSKTRERATGMFLFFSCRSRLYCGVLVGVIESKAWERATRVCFCSLCRSRYSCGFIVFPLSVNAGKAKVRFISVLALF